MTLLEGEIRKVKEENGKIIEGSLVERVDFYDVDGITIEPDQVFLDTDGKKRTSKNTDYVPKCGAACGHVRFSYNQGIGQLAGWAVGVYGSVIVRENEKGELYFEFKGINPPSPIWGDLKKK